MSACVRIRAQTTSRTLFRALPATLTCVLATLFVVGCPSPEPPSQGQVTAVTLRLPWIYNIESAGILVARERGFYRANGIDLTIQQGGVGLNPVQLVGGGSEDFGIADGAAVVIGRAKGVPVKALAAEYQKSPFAYTTLEKSGIAKVEDFRGKRIGTQSFSVYVLETMLASRGMTLKDVKMTPVQFDPQPLVQGQVDAFLSFVTDQPILLEMKGMKTNVIRASDYGYPFYGNVIFTKEKTLQEQPQVVGAFLEATFQGWKTAFEDIPGTTAMVVDKYNNKLDKKHQQVGLEKLWEIMTDGVGVHKMGHMDKLRWQQSVDVLLKYRQIDKSVPAEEIVADSSYSR